MIKYAKLINNETGLCEVGLGENNDFYKSIGMIELDVQLSDVDNKWYLSVPGTQTVWRASDDFVKILSENGII